MELIEQLRAAGRGFVADDFGSVLGRPEVISLGADHDELDSYLAWALDGRGATESVGGVEIVVPNDISPDDRTLDFDVLVALSQGGGDGEQVMQQLQFNGPSIAGERNTATIVTSPITVDVSGKRAHELFIISHSPGTNFNAGDRVRLSVRRESSHTYDTYPHHLYMLAVTVAYRREPQ